jgi:uncharacterized protein
MPVQMELARIIISEINDQQVIYLREVDGPRVFPILIGIFEATSIDRHVKQVTTPRPLTHDLLVNSVTALGGELQDVVITELREHTYYSVLRIRRDGELFEIDSRPSDAIAVAVTCDPPLPIYVNEEVLQDVLSDKPETDQTPDFDDDEEDAEDDDDFDDDEIDPFGDDDDDDEIT